ncbi:MAG: PASTA domain-containing protein [Gemmatimonadota bacterium]
MKLGGSLERRRRRRSARGGEGAGQGPFGPVPSVRLVGVIAAIALVGWGVGYLLATRVVFPAPPPPGDMFEVPDLRGVDLETARERLAGARLELGEVDSITHPGIEASRVVGQSPIPGQAALPDTPVDVTVSLGPQRRSVPDVRGLASSQALVVLRASGFFVDTDSAESEEPRGRVVEMSPSPDTEVSLPARVSLVVSTGPALISMPLVLGLEEAEALSVLDSLGLAVAEVREVFRFGRDQGIVVEQEPAAETELRRGDEVSLAVGRRGDGGEQ